jgi:hypothetical protein
MRMTDGRTIPVSIVELPFGSVDRPVSRAYRESMNYERLPYDEASTPTEMASDCKAVGLALHLPRQVSRVAKTALDAMPSLPDGLVPQPPAQVKRATIAVSDAAAKFAGRFLD